MSDTQHSTGSANGGAGRSLFGLRGKSPRAAGAFALVAGLAACNATQRGTVSEAEAMGTNGSCPVMHDGKAAVADASYKTTPTGVMTNSDWWPNQLN